MCKTIENSMVFFLGAVGYGICELVYRGFTHWTMLVLGGVCFLGLYYNQKYLSSLPLVLRCVSGGVFITSLELITGSIINLIFGMAVWDYSHLHFNLFGQICLQFTLLWMLLCLPAFLFCRIIQSSLRKKCTNFSVFSAHNG